MGISRNLTRSGYEMQDHVTRFGHHVFHLVTSKFRCCVLRRWIFLGYAILVKMVKLGGGALMWFLLSSLLPLFTIIFIIKYIFSTNCSTGEHRSSEPIHWHGKSVCTVHVNCSYSNIVMKAQVMLHWKFLCLFVILNPLPNSLKAEFRKY